MVSTEHTLSMVVRLLQLSGIHVTRFQYRVKVLTTIEFVVGRFSYLLTAQVQWSLHTHLRDHIGS